MTTHKNRGNGRAVTLDPKEELISALRPLRRVIWVSNFIKKMQRPQINMPKGKHANTEKFILGLSLCLCLFMKNHSSLIRYGKPLKNYTNKHAAHVLPTQAPLIKNKLYALIDKFSNKAK